MCESMPPCLPSPDTSERLLSPRSSTRRMLKLVTKVNCSAYAKIQHTLHDVNAN